MRRPQYSISGFLAVITMLGVAFGALRSPSYLWANVTFSVAFAAIVLALLNAILGRGARRAYWLGFFVCSAAYFAVCTVPGLRDSVCPRLGTEPIFDFVYSVAFPELQAAPAASFAQLHLSPGSVMVNTRGGWIAQPGTIHSALAPASPLSRWAAWTATDHNIGVGYQIGTVSLVSSEAFRQIGHSLATLLVAALGALYARRRYEAWAAERLRVSNSVLPDHQKGQKGNPR